MKPATRNDKQGKIDQRDQKIKELEQKIKMKRLENELRNLNEGWSPFSMTFADTIT